jgi:peptidoglycan/xylan/chitin deacetylase (PgdA/CDA1 family)
MHYTTLYEEVKKYKSSSLRNVLRNIALTGLSFQIHFPGSISAFRRPRVHFLLLHHVFDDEIKHFEELLMKLSFNHTFIAYGEAVDKILNAEIDKPYISFSFDDGLKNNLTASRIMDKYNAKACFFVNPDIVGIKDYNKIKKFCETKLDYPPTEFMDWDDIDTLLKRGHEIGSHTLGHINIADTSINEVEDNLNKSFESILAKCGVSEHFAYPFGSLSHFNQPAFELVFKSGYKSCASGVRGCHISVDRINPEELMLRRDQILCDWNMNHSMYFIYNSSKHSRQQDNYSPYINREPKGPAKIKI